MYKIQKKYRELPNTLKAAFWLTVSNVILKGISFFTAPMFASILSTNEYGKLSLFNSYEQIIVIFATWEVGLSPFQRGLFRYKGQKRSFRTTVILFAMILSLGIGFLVWMFRDIVTTFTEMPIWLLGAMGLYTFFYTAYTSWMTENKLMYSYKKVSLMTMTLAILQIVISLYAVYKIKASAEIKFLFTLIPAILIDFILFIRRFRLFDILHNFSEIKKQLKFLFFFTWPLVIHSLSYLILGQADRIMIGKMVGNEEAGLYSVAYTIASVVIIVQTAVLQVLSPWIYHCMDKKKYNQIKKNSQILLLMVSVIYLLFILIAPDIIILLYPEYYWEGIWCIPPISMGVYFMFMYSLFVAIEECLEQTKYVALVSFTCAGLNIVLNYIGIEWIGYIACAYTTLFCYIMFALGHFFFMTRILKKQLNGVKIFDGKYFLTISITMLFLMIVFTYIYAQKAIRYSVILILFSLCFAFKKRIIHILSELKNKN